MNFSCILSINYMRVIFQYFFFLPQKSFSIQQPNYKHEYTDFDRKDISILKVAFDSQIYGIQLKIITNKLMNRKNSHQLIRNTYNFETAHQKQTKAQLENVEKGFPIQSVQTPQQKFANSIKEMQNKIEGMESWMKLKSTKTDSNIQLAPNIGQVSPSSSEKSHPLINKIKLLNKDECPQHRRPHQQNLKPNESSPIRKSYRFPEPTKYSYNPIKIPPLNLHSISMDQNHSYNEMAASAGSTSTSPSPQKFPKKIDHSKSYHELSNLNQSDASFTVKLNGSFMNLFNEQQKDKSQEPTAIENNKQMKGVRMNKSLTFLNIKNTLEQIKNKSNIIRKSKGKVVNGFEIGKLLGKGKFGQVFLARHVDTGFVVALKKVEKKSIKQMRMETQFIEQIKLHSCLDHPTIVKFYGFFEQGEHIYIIMEYVNGGTLFDYQNDIGILSVKEAAQFLKDIIEALAYLHSRSIAHRDIKPQNIVITFGIAKLCDFGWSAVVDRMRETFCGTLDYAPPQIIERRKYDCSVDLWCVGVLAYQLLVGRAPFESTDRREVMQRIVNVDKTGVPQFDEIPPQAQQFVKALLQKDPSSRPRISQLLDFDFFRHSSPSKVRKVCTK